MTIFEVAGDFKVQATVGASRGGAEGHSGFLGGAISLFDVAMHTGGDNVGPGVFAAARSRNDVIEGEFVATVATVASVATVLAVVAVAVQDILPGEGYFLVGNIDVLAQADDRGERGAEAKEFAALFELDGFVFEEQDDRALPTRDVERFKGGVQDEDLTHEGFMVLGDSGSGLGGLNRCRWAYIWAYTWAYIWA
jgi:hypothetical protein